MRMMKKTGGIAALVTSLTVVVGIGMYATLLSDYATGDLDPAGSVAFLSDHQAAIFVWHLVTLIVFAIFLVPVAFALNERLKAGTPVLAQVATGFGLIWAGLLIAAGMILNIGLGIVVDLVGASAAQAESLWLAVDSIANGLSGGMEIVGPVWILLVSGAALRSGALPRALNYVGIVMSVSGLLTIVPALEDVGIIFGLGLIVWFAWLGITMYRDDPSEA